MHSTDTIDTRGADKSWLRWIIAITVSFAAILEIIDTSIVNVALPHMQGNLGATLSEIGWVVTGYSIANVIIIPLSAWLGDKFGRKPYFIFSLVGFTLASVLCGFANSLVMLVASRILQGLCGGGLLAKAQAVLFETFPPEEQGLAQAIFGFGVIIGPVMGPTLGGYLTDVLNWRWIFFINIPFGMLAIAMAVAFLPQGEKKQISKSVDWLGIFLLVVSIGSFQTFLEQGEQYDWFGCYWITILAVVSVIGMAAFIWRELTTKYPAVDLRVLRHKSLAAGSIYSAVLGMGLYGAMFAVPIFAQTILNFTAMQTGMMLLPGALASAAMMPVLGKLSSKIDARLMIGFGSIITAATMFQLAVINPSTGTDSLFWPLVMRGAGSVFMFMSLSLATLGPIPKQDISAASGFYNLTRQLGGSIGVAALTTLLDRREQFHRAILVENLNFANSAYVERFNALTASFKGMGFDLTQAHMKAMSVIDGLVNMQSSIISFGDIFWIVGICFVISLPLLVFLGNGRSNRQAAAAGH
jgi:MFS transporter, DHA2 family, multidrug resistance protein